MHLDTGAKKTSAQYSLMNYFSYALPYDSAYFFFIYIFDIILTFTTPFAKLTR